MNLLNSRTQAAVVSLVNTVLGLGVAFNVALTGPQQGAVLAVVNAGFVLAILLTGQTPAAPAKSK